MRQRFGRHAARSRFRRASAVAGAILVVAGIAPMLSTTPASATNPTFTFSENAPATVLYGTPATVLLTATATGSAVGYNLSIEDVLPAGVSYVAGSSTPSTIGDPLILPNEPSTGRTTLIWSNVSDLQPSSSFALGFNLQGAIDTTVPTPPTIILPGDTYADSATGYVDADPREVTQFSAAGTASNFTTAAGPTSGTTEISPLTTTLTDPLPESELERGVHDQQKVWTLTVTDNSVHATALSLIDAWLPAGLEYLGCGAVDNTTSATTTFPDDPGPAPFHEYPGAPDLTSGVTVPTSGSPIDDTVSAPCALATSVSTEDTVPPGLSGSDNESDPLYTQAHWVFGTGGGDLAPTTLAPDQTYTIRYLAAVPLLENSTTFDGGTPTGPTEEGSNLDNNNGADTLALAAGTGSNQTTAAQATGVYAGALGAGANPATADGQDTVTIHDLAIQKSVSSTSFVQGSDVTFTLDYETSEYRYSQTAVFTDVVPNGLCPLSAATNYDQDTATGAADVANHADCAPQAGSDPSVPYASVTENQGPTPDAGSFTLEWNLPTLTTNLNGTITYTVADRSSYQDFTTAFGPAAPTLTGDAFENTVTVAAATFATCENGGTSDPECAMAGASAIYPTGEPGGPSAPISDAAAESNPSSAGQTAAQPTIRKLIGVPIPDGGGGVTCAGASYSSSTTLVFQKGDVACFQLTVNFPADLNTRDPVVEDYLPPNSTYVGTGTDGSGPGPGNTVAIPAPVPSSPPAVTNGDQGKAANPVVSGTSDGDLLNFYLGATVPSSANSSIYAGPGQVFQYDIGTTITASPGTGNTFDVTENLMKYTSFNSPDLAVASRSDAPYTLDTPSLSLLKGVVSSGTTTDPAGNITTGGAFNSNKDGVAVDDGGNAVFRIDISNWGNFAVSTPTIWDPLQSGQTCAAISSGSIADGGTCFDAGSTGVPTGIDGDTATVTDATIVWSGSDIASIAAAASATVPGELTLTYQYDIPVAAATGDKFIDRAGVVSFVASPNSGTASAITYYPQSASNIATTDGFTLPTSLAGNDSFAPSPPSGTVEEDSSNVFVADPGITKVVSPGSATIGQDAQYTITATSPLGGALYSGVTTDALGSRLTYDPAGPFGPATAACSGGAVSGTPTMQPGGSAGGFSLTEASNTLTLDWPNLADAPTNAVCTITFDAVVANTAANFRSQTIPNVATFGYHNESGGAGTGSPVSSVAVNVTVTEPDISLTKTDSDAPTHQGSPGSTVTYTLTLADQNLGNVSAANDMVVVDCVQGGATYVSNSSIVSVPGRAVLNSGVVPGAAEPATGACGAGNTQLTWTVNALYGATVALAKNATASITYQTLLPSQPVGTDTFPNAATFTVSSLDVGASPAARTTSSSNSAYSASSNDTVTAPGASVTKVAAPASVPVGVDSTFTATVDVPANLSFPDLTAVDLLPDGMTFDAYVSASCADVTAPATPCGNDIASPITTEAADHGGAAGTTTLAWWIGNVAADADARLITLTYTAYPSPTYVGGTTVTAGDALLNTIGAYWGDAGGSATPDAPAPSTGPTFGFSHQSGTQPATITVLAPQLTLHKSTTVTNPTPGQIIPFAVTVTNTSDNPGATPATYGSTAVLTTVTDPIPALLSVTSVAGGGVLSGAGPDGSGGSITWTLTGQTIAPGATLTATYTATLAPSSDFSSSTDTDPIVNTATVNTYYAVDDTVATPSPTRYDAYAPNSQGATVTPVFPALAIAKYSGSTGTSTTGSSDIGRPTPWHLAVTEPSAATVQSLSVVDTLPAFWTYDTGTTSIVTENLGTVTADPSTSTSATTHVETLTWSGLGILDNTHGVSVAYQATPGVGAQLDAPGNTNAAFAAADDATGLSGIGSAGTFRAYQSAAATANDTIAQADLSITKSNGANFVSGANGTYSLVVTNHGPDPAAEPITVTDPLPTGETFVSAAGTGWSCGSAATTVTCTFGSDPGTAPAGAVGGAISLVVNVASSVGLGVAVITNTASVSDNGTFDPNPANNSSADPTSVVGADLSIVKSHSGTFIAGQNGTYSLVVANHGPSASAGPITVNDTLPPGETVSSAPTGTGWSCSATSPIVCTHATAVPNGASAGAISVPVTIASSATGNLTNTATVTPGPTDDPDLTNNSSSDPSPLVTSADLTVAKTLTTPASGIVAGQNATYTVNVHDLGPSDAVAPQVQDVLPAGETFVSAAGTGWSCADAAGTVTCTDTAAATLAAGTSTAPISLVVAVGSGVVTPITNTAIVCSGTIGTGSNTCTGGVEANGTPDPVAANNTSSAPSSPAVAGDLAIQKTHSGDFVSGAQGTYAIVVTDNGPADSVGTAGSPIVVSDTLPAGETFMSGTGTGWTCSNAAPIVTCTYPGTIVATDAAPAISLTVAVGPSLGTVVNQAQVTPGATPDGDPTNNIATDPTTIVGADLSITKTHSGSLVAGANGTYTLTVTNGGPAASAGPITVIDTLPTGETFVAANGTDWACAAGAGSSAAIVTCTEPSSVTATTSTAPISLIVAVGGAVTGSLTNTAEVVPGTTTDPDPSNNTVTDPAAIATQGNLGIIKSHTGTFVLHQAGNYTLAVTNYGPSVDPGPITVIDPLPDGETFVSATGPDWTCTNATSTVTCALVGPLVPAQAAPPIALVVDIGIAAYPAVTNTASVSSPTFDSVMSNNASSDPITLRPIIDPVVVPPAPAAPGSSAPTAPNPTAPAPPAQPGTSILSLAVTGLNLVSITLGALLLLLSGLATVAVDRRRRPTTSTHRRHRR